MRVRVGCWERVPGFKAPPLGIILLGGRGRPRGCRGRWSVQGKAMRNRSDERANCPSPRSRKNSPRACAINMSAADILAVSRSWFEAYSSMLLARSISIPVLFLAVFFRRCLYVGEPSNRENILWKVGLLWIADRFFWPVPSSAEEALSELPSSEANSSARRTAASSSPSPS